MTPKKLHLRRFCQHEDRELVFAEGLNSCEGPNGSGKTNILMALCLCLGLDVNSAKKKSDLIQDGYEKAEVTLEFTHRDTPGHIKIALKRNYPRNWEAQSLMVAHAEAKSKANAEDPRVTLAESENKLIGFTPREKMDVSMEWGTVKCRNSTELTAWIRAEVGVDPKLIVSNFFPRQGDIDGALSSDKAERQAVFAEKAGTALCEKIWAELGLELRGLPDLSGIPEAHAQAKMSLAMATAAYAEAEKSVEVFSGKQLDPGPAGVIVQRHITGNAERLKLGALQAEAAQALAEIQKQSKEEERLKAEGILLAEKSAAAVMAREAAVVRMSSLQAAVTRAERRHQMVSELNAAKEKLGELLAHVPQDPPSDADLSTLAQAAGEYSARLNELTRWLQVFATGKCPTCGAPVSPEHLEKAKVDHVAVGQSFNDTNAKRVSLLNAKQQLWAAKSAWEAGVTGLRAKIAQLEANLGATPEEQVPEGVPVELERLRGVVLEAKELETRLGALRGAYMATKGLLDRLQGTSVGLLRQIEELTKAVEGAPGEEEYQRASKELLGIQADLQAFSEAKVAKGIAKGRLEDAETQAKAWEAKASAIEPERLWREAVEAARALFHREALPAEVVAWYASELVGHTMTYLKMFDVNFSVIVTPDLSLMAVFPDKVMPVAELSGGEKNMLNVSMRLAMVDLFPSDLRILILDEVEVHLDQANVAKLPILLEKVKGLARGRGLVVLFISHHPALRDIADNVIYTQVA